MSTSDITEIAAATEESAATVLGRFRSMGLMGGLKFLVLILVLLVLVRLLTSLIYKGIQRSKLDRSVHGFLRSLTRIVLYFIAATIAAASLGVNVTSLIAVLSVAGLAVSLALQGALANLASGLVILTTKPFKVGDYVNIDNVEGTVEEITMTYTKIVPWDQRTVYVPNSTVTGSKVMNHTVAGMRRLGTTFSASYDNSVDQVKAALMEAVMEVEPIRKDQEIFIHINSFGESAIEYVVRVWVDAADYWDVWFALPEAVKRSFDRNGVQFTYNHLNVHLNS